MNYEVEKVIVDTLQSMGKTKKIVYEGIGMTPSGFDKMLKNKTLTVENLQKIANILQVSPTIFFTNAENSDNIVRDAKAKYVVQQNGNGSNQSSIEENKSLKDEVEFLRKQVQTLSGIIEKLTTKS